MIRIHYAEDLNKGDEVLVRFDDEGSYSKRFVTDIKDQFVGLSVYQYTNPTYRKLSEIELYKDA